MESATSQSMLEILNECLKDSNLETVSKAELRIKYLKKTGLTKLPHEDKKLFASAVNTAYLNHIGNKAAIADIVDERKVDEAPDDEIKESDNWKLVMSSTSDDDITPENMKEHAVNDKFMNGEKDIKETSDDEVKENGEHEKLGMDSSPVGNISHVNLQEKAIDDEIMNKMESSSDLDDQSLALQKDNIKKSPLPSTLNGFERQRGKRTFISSSEDEIVQLKPSKRNKALKKARRSEDLETSLITKSEERKKASIGRKNQKRAISESSDSEDEPLIVIRKKSNSLSGSSLSKSDESEKECFSKFKKKQFSNPADFEEGSIMLSTKKKTKSIDNSKNNLSDSEDEPLKIFQNSNKSISSNGEKIKFETKLKSTNISSDSDDEPLTKYRKINDSIHSDKNFNSSHKLSKSIESTSGSDNESLLKYSKKKKGNSIDSTDSENECLNDLNNKKKDNSYESKMKTSEKNVKEKVNHSLKKPLTNHSKSKEETLKKKRIIDSEDDDSDEQPIATLVKNSDPVNRSLKSVENFSYSEDEPLNKLSKKKTDNFKNSEKEPVEKILKETLKHSVKRPLTNKNKSKELTLKKKRFVDSDDDADSEEEKSFNQQKDSLLSDSCEDEPLSNIKKELHNSSVSENDARLSNQKGENSFKEQKNCLLSDSCEDESLSSMIKKANSSSDSEDEPLHKLSTQKSEKKQKDSGSNSSSFVDENEEQSNRKNKSSKRKPANDSGKGKKRPSASENKIEHLKKYLRVAGIRISNYNKLFENCKSMKAKCEKMMSLLEKEGLKGRPTLEKCKKLRVKIETKKEIAELDTSNILKGGGRPKRSVCSDTTNCERGEEKSTPIKKFSRLQDIVDSEESD